MGGTACSLATSAPASVEVRPVATVAHGERDDAKDRYQRHRGVRAQLYRGFSHLDAFVHSGEARFADQDFFEQPFDEVRLAPAACRSHRFCGDAEAASNRPEKAIDRRALLRSAREVDAAEQDLLIETRRFEDLTDKLCERIAEGGHLLRKREHRRPAPHVPILIEPGEQPLDSGA